MVSSDLVRFPAKKQPHRVCVSAHARRWSFEDLMLARLFLLLLLLNLAVPSGVLAKAFHHCSMPEAKQRACPCGEAPEAHSGAGSHAENRACCEVGVPRREPPAHLPISSAPQPPIPIVADIPLVPLPALSMAARSVHRFSRKHAQRPGRGAPVFLFCCSFLI
jgi:hypothetical protein